MGMLTEDRGDCSACSGTGWYHQFKDGYLVRTPKQVCGHCRGTGRPFTPLGEELLTLLEELFDLFPKEKD